MTRPLALTREEVEDSLDAMRHPWWRPTNQGYVDALRTAAALYEENEGLYTALERLAALVGEGHANACAQSSTWWSRNVAPWLSGASR